ncbi:NAD(P)-dependent oxidoreductase [Terasakiella sp. A23]|uniref:SDR family oxidoreductase n=1 Tax=Terasakiella sp. FCG-A23 TaxID=3080561 RepID=UPI0029553708|nr:NAD(P)-dependent oxidoreductase [Terasakiella sp. A23]MDV7341542.1 NAD(P)-dependent oxidoreductase [Terasakiella sp. A23]
MTNLKGKTLFVSGASRGIGLEIAKRCAADGANVALLAKTDTPHPKLPGTIHTAAEEIKAAGGNALPMVVDIRDENAVQKAVDQTVAHFGGIDICINNASAISLTGTLETPMKRFDLMHQINTRGTYAVSQACIPALLKSDNPHILNLSPPLNMDANWFKDHTAYTIAKYGMSMCVLGMAEEFRGQIGVNALWPRTVINTAAIAMIEGVDARGCRTPDIVADAAYEIFKRDAKTCTGNFFMDDEVLAEAGITDLTKYAVDPEAELLKDLFL